MAHQVGRFFTGDGVLMRQAFHLRSRQQREATRLLAEQARERGGDADMILAAATAVDEPVGPQRYDLPKALPPEGVVAHGSLVASLAARQNVDETAAFVAERGFVHSMKRAWSAAFVYCGLGGGASTKGPEPFSQMTKLSRLKSQTAALVRPN